ncbi:MAG: DegV family protein [Chloroflexi bacterium]|jgi:DegV family protein with EDD domain|nr:DegV family protein [Chloroflexota bacterium]MBT3668856.1 DegV family protein [Chloroflexota bacterium]MBT4002761.1 DegV family protein [Chloroflexota bacterium]MBT4306570.1 DegV family protein [Chloroflexota bacterium]MBT4533954.1 DegV family protein [Chloroflexota bacterium]
MANKVAIVTDSTATIPEKWIKKYGIKFAASLVLWDGEELRDGIDITPDKFFIRLANSSTIPTSSQPSPADFKSIYEKLIKKGYDILSIHLSPKLSGTMASAEQAKQMLPKANIEIVNTWSVSMGEGWPILMAAEAAKAGKTLAECKKIAEDAVAHTGIYLTVNTLEFLHRGGRIGGAARLLGSALRLKPILTVAGGQIEPVEKIRTRKKALKRLVAVVGEEIKGKENIHVAALHANALEDAEQVMEMVKKEYDVTESLIAAVAPTIGTHTGPGTIGLAYMAGYK